MAEIADRLRLLAKDVEQHGWDWEIVARLMREGAAEIDRLTRVVTIEAADKPMNYAEWRAQPSISQAWPAE